MIAVLATSFVVLGVLVQYFLFLMFSKGQIRFGILFHIHMCGIFRNQIPLPVALFQCLHIAIRHQIVFYLRMQRFCRHLLVLHLALAYLIPLVLLCLRLGWNMLNIDFHGWNFLNSEIPFRVFHSRCMQCPFSIEALVVLFLAKISSMKKLRYWIMPRNCWSSSRFVGLGFAPVTFFWIRVVLVNLYT